MVATQRGYQKLKIIEPPGIKKKLRDEFDEAISVRVQEEDAEVTGLVTKGAYTPKDLDSDSKTGWSIVADAKFVTELVDMDFSKEGTNCDFKVLFQKVPNKINSCNATIDNLDAICFGKIIKDFKASNFGHIFSKTGFPKKADHLELIGAKHLFLCTLAIRRSKWELPDTV